MSRFLIWDLRVSVPQTAIQTPMPLRCQMQALHDTRLQRCWGANILRARIISTLNSNHLKTFPSPFILFDAIWFVSLRRGDAYNLKADVYSFAIVLWEILSVRTPYAFARKRHQLINYVGKLNTFISKHPFGSSCAQETVHLYAPVEEHGRPEIDLAWPVDVQETLKSSFDNDLGKRPVSIVPAIRV